MASLLGVLEELEKSELETFVFHLQNLPECFERIPKSKVHQKTRVEVTQEMIEIYGVDKGFLVTVEILKKMMKNNLANKIQKQISKKRTMSDPNAVPSKKPNSPSQTCQPAEVENTPDKALQYIKRHKDCLKNKNDFMVEETTTATCRISLNEIYTNLIITEGECQAHNNEHEVLMNSHSLSYETRINCNDIFLHNGEEVKTVLTKGVAGVGKTVSVQKFIVDWAEDKANQDVKFLFVLPFRQLNLIKGDHSLHTLLVHLHPNLDCCDSGMYANKILFIFDGLEESRIQMNFSRAEIISKVDVKSTVENLVVNLIRGDLVPSAHIWITSRPAAASRIPSKYIHRVTEIQGFSDSQKEDYFRKKVKDTDKAKMIISHIKTARSLHIMCHIPVFCWISVTALQPWLTPKFKGEIPTTLTEMYCHFLLVQMKTKNEKFDERPKVDSELVLESNSIMILKLAKLAFEQLLKCQFLFYESDLKECEIDVQDSFLYSGLCTEFFKPESAFYCKKVYCFVHLSFQEFFSALYVFYCFLCQKNGELKMFLPKTKAATSEIRLDVLMKHVVNEALKSTNGHLDLFLRFLHGMSLESNQRLLHGILPHTTIPREYIGKIKQNLKQGQKKNINPERWLNLSNCLIEMKDDTLQKETQTYLESKKKSKKLNLAQCSAMAYMFQVSETVINELDLKKFNTTEEGRRRLIPALRNCKKAILADCNLTEMSCESIAQALQSANSPLRELDLSSNDLQDAGLKRLFNGPEGFDYKLEIIRLSNCKLAASSCDVVASVLKSSLRELDLSYNDLQNGVDKLVNGLKIPKCELKTLRISDCKLTATSCKYISEALKKSPLRELDLSCNNLQDTGMKWLSEGLQSMSCNLAILKLSDCKLTGKSCTYITSVLKKPNTSLRELDLSDNDLRVSGVKALSDGLKSPGCVLEILRLSGCCLTAESASLLISALKSNPTHLTDLDLSYNHLGSSGQQQQLLLLKTSSVYKLHTIRLDQDKELRIKPGLKKYACELTLDLNTANKRLSLTADNSTVTLLGEDQSCQNHKQRFQNAKQVLCKEALSGRCYWEVEWNGAASIAVAYKSISKKGSRKDCMFGCSKKSWSLELSKNDECCSCVVVHNNKGHNSMSVPPAQCNGVGVYVDYPAGILSFYTISSDTHTPTHIHTFRTTFIEPLFAGFGLKDVGDSIALIYS